MSFTHPILVGKEGPRLDVVLKWRCGPLGFVLHAQQGHRVVLEDVQGVLRPSLVRDVGVLGVCCDPSLVGDACGLTCLRR